jgi:hypothetical protein
MTIIEELRGAWGWAGIDPLEVIDENEFGNLIIKDVRGQYWRLMPEECCCEVIAENRPALDALTADQEFQEDWDMTELVDMAKESLGPLTEGRKYCLKVPGLLGGEYDVENFGTAPLVELIRMSGDIAKQVEELPPGTQVTLKIAE